MKKRILISMLAVMVLAVGAFFGTLASSARINVFAQAASESTPSNLFNEDGTLNSNQAAKILNALNAANTTVKDKETEFRLFAGIGEDNTLALSSLNWRITNIDGDRLTFWASQSYRESDFNLTGNGNAYNTSLLRTNLLSDWQEIADSVSEHILPHGTETDNANTSDLIWIPSTSEVSSKWVLDKELRCFDSNGFEAWAWYRDAHENGTHTYIGSNAGSSGSISPVQNSLSVRPALHISLASLLEAAPESELCDDCGKDPCECEPTTPTLPTDEKDVPTWLLVTGIIGGLIVLTIAINLVNAVLFGKRRRY